MPLEPRTAQAAKQSLIMHIYQLCFDWNVIVINDYISVYNAAVCTGVLDIFGFENFSLNSFPQLCINFTNESLHNLFIEHGARPSAASTAASTSTSATTTASSDPPPISSRPAVFKLEQEVYVREEVEWNFVAYEDNQPVLDLIAKRPVCILGLLDEGCATGSGKDSSVLENYHSTFTQAKYKAYIKPKKSADRTFVLSHYAGEVIYTIEGWIEKNKDELPPTSPRAR